jgi:hypothetical protein
MMPPLEDCCYRCIDCSRVVCRENETSPGEPERCTDCHEFADWLAGGAGGVSGLAFYPRSHRYKLDGAWVPGVTTILGKGIAKPFLVDWAAREVAGFAADHLDVLNALDDRDARYDLLKTAHNRHRDKAAVRGTDVHGIAEKLLHGEEVEIPEHIEGYVEGYVRFLDAWQPTPIITERPCASREHWFAGTADAFLTLPSGERLLMDWKTGKRVYGETALQLAAYQHAEFYVDENDEEQPIPEVDSLAVVHVTPTGTDVYRIADPEAAWKQFRHCAWLAGQADAIKDQIGAPCGPPTKGAAA